MTPVTALCLGRVGLGVLCFTRPTLASSLVGLDARPGEDPAYFARLFGVREVAVGALTLLARGTARRDLVLAGIAVDLGDAAAGVVGLRSGDVSARAALPLVAVGLGAAAAAAASQAQESQQAR